MRKILLFRGAPGAGKSTTIRDLGLEDYTISSDQIRLLISSPILSRDGKMGISQEPNVNKQTWSLVYALMDERTRKGDFLVVDCTNQSASDFKGLYDVAKRRGYDVSCLDYASMPLDRLKKQNLMRSAHRQVPEEVIERMHQRMKEWDLPRDVRAIQWEANGSHVDKIRHWMTLPTHDYSNYESVLHIGDLQGCPDPLLDPVNGLLKDGLRDDTRYIFVGDLLDRGPDNGKLMRWVLDKALSQPNVDFIWGNHETHLVNWAYGEELKSPEFIQRTLPQLEAEGITPREMRIFAQRLHECITYKWNDKNVFVCHGGLSTVPENPVLIQGRQMTHGTGVWADPIDQQFSANAPDGWYQIHGHRNHNFAPLLASKNSFNLENSIENGGNLRALELNEAGFRGIEIKNRRTVPVRERLSNSSRSLPPWMERDESNIFMSEDDLDLLQNHKVAGKPGIRFKQSEEFPHISSINFTKKVFYKQAWDDVVVKARGMFINNETREVVARSYDKFFNVNEREETDPEYLADSVEYPLHVYNKENGYLGILGYDSHRDEALFASKSTPEGYFAELFREIAEETISPTKLDALRRFMKEMEASLVFEVIDPVRDPHIISYPERKIVLLDVFHRSSQTEKLSYKDLKKFAKQFGLECKQHLFSIKDEKQLLGFLNQTSKPNLDKNDSEGYVIEDEIGYSFKVKLFYYSFWKAMRSVKDRVRANKEKGGDVNAIQPVFDGGYKEQIWSQPIAIEFLEWCKTKEPEQLTKGILELKEEFCLEQSSEYKAEEEKYTARKVM